VYGFCGEGKTAYIDARDIAECAAAVLTEGAKHYGKEYYLTGSEAFSEPELFKLVGQVIGKEVKYVDIPEAKYRETLASYGLSKYDVDNIAGLDLIRSKGWMGNTSPAVKDLTGHEPRKLGAWLRENVETLRSLIPEEKKAAPAGSKQDMVLYHVSPSRSNRVAWLVYELGLENRCAIEEIQWKQIKSAKHKAVDPNGRVPAFSHGDFNLFEAGAIMEYLSRVAGNPLTPKDWSDKQVGNHFKFVFWTISTLDQKLIEASGAVKKVFSSGTHTWWHSTVVPVLMAQLSQHEYIMGKNFTITDVYLGYSLYWAHKAGLLAHEQDKVIAEYYARLAARPAFKKVFGEVVVKPHAGKHHH